MKKILFLIGICGCALGASSQNIVAAEYFFNTDPGVGNGISTSVGVQGPVVNFTANIPVALAPGFHQLAVRTVDDAGVWSHYETRGFFISTATSGSANIVAAEYFIDGDPGPGNGIAMNVGAPGSTVNFSAVIPAALSNGFHFIAIRVKDANGTWGLYESRGFYLSGSTANTSNITQAEYFFDADPGLGNGIPASVGASGSTVNFTTTIPNSLPAGFHFLAIRVRDQQGIWGLYETRGFYISSNTTNSPDITASEYFIDTDPGVGNGIPLSVGTTGAAVNFTASIPASLPPGFHRVAIRTRDAVGNWGLFENRMFYLTPAANDMEAITEMEYFFDADPGVGAAAKISFGTSGNVVNQTFSIPVPIGISQGQHFIAIRVRDINNNWSLFEFDTITVSGTLPLHLLNFTGRRNNNIVALNWKTTNEVNTSHFIVERSKDGVNFSPIGNVPSFNTAGDHDYSFNDLHPFSGLNFYRLRQVDIDARFKYSPVVRVLMSDAPSELRVYPNPVSDKLFIEYSTAQRSVLVNIYDASGRSISTSSYSAEFPLAIDVSRFSAGKYFIQLTDGVVNRQVQFLKQ